MMDAYKRGFLILICTYFTLKLHTNGETSYAPNTYTRIKIFPHDNLGNCQNGGTQISRNTCRCPGPLFGNYCNHSLYMSFDTLERITLMQGTTQMYFDALSQGLIDSAVHTNRSLRQWIDLGFHPEVCLSHRDGCSPAGGAFSMWLRLIECQNNGGIITTKAFYETTGFNVECSGIGTLNYVYDIRGGFFNTRVPQQPPRPSHNNWFHMVFNFIGPHNGEGFRVYLNGELVSNVTEFFPSNRFARIHGRIVIGRSFTERDEHYTSIHMDQLMFLNQALTEEEIQMLSR